MSTELCWMAWICQRCYGFRNSPNGKAESLLEDLSLTHFRDMGNFTENKKRFNLLQSWARSVFEVAFGMHKNKLRCLKSFDMSLENEIPEMIMACIHLHNFIKSSWKCYHSTTIYNKALFSHAVCKYASIRKPHS